MFTKGEVIEFLQKCFGEAGKQTNGGRNIAFYCPFCKDLDSSKKKLVILTENPFYWHCWKCNKKGRSLSILLRRFYSESIFQEFKNKFLEGKEINGYEIDESEDDLALSKLTLPQGFELLANASIRNNYEAYMALKYLRQERGISDRDLWYLKFGITKQDIRYKQRLIIPSFNNEGELNFFSTRSYSKYCASGVKYIHCGLEKTDIIFNEINIDWTKELTVCEGPFDLIKANNNATCLLGSTLDENHFLFQKIIENNTPILICFDDDAVKKSYVLARLLSQYGIEVRIFNLPKNIHDLGQMKKENFLSLLPGTKSYEDSDYLKYRIENL